MAGDYKTGRGGSLNDGTGAFPGIVEVTPFSPEGEVEKYLCIDQPDPYYRKVTTCIDAGKLEFEQLYNKTQLARCVALLDTQRTYTFTTNDTSAATTTCVGFMVKVSQTGWNSEKIPRIKGTIELSGQPVTS